jgi:hypothetical protein
VVVGSDWLWAEGRQPVLQLVNRDSGAEIRPVVVDERIGQRLDLARTRLRARSE